jgi:hypothetical protein
MSHRTPINSKEIVSSYLTLIKKPEDLVKHIDELKWADAQLHYKIIKRELKFLEKTSTDGIHLYFAQLNKIRLSLQIKKEYQNLDSLCWIHNGYSFSAGKIPLELQSTIKNLEEVMYRLHEHILGLDGRDRLEQSIKCDQVFQYTLGREQKDPDILESNTGSLDEESESKKPLSVELVKATREKILTTQANMALEVLEGHDLLVNQYRSIETENIKKDEAINQLVREKEQLQALLEAAHVEQDRLNQDVAATQGQLVEAGIARETLQTQFIAEKARNERLQQEIETLREHNQALKQTISSKEELSKISCEDLVKLINKHSPVFFAKEKEFESLSALAVSREIITLGDIRKVIQHNQRLLQISENPLAHEGYKTSLANFIRELATKFLIEVNSQQFTLCH